ncbi:MAG: aminoacyl-tRNA hydrolase [Actinomycetota bacterium]|nr:aminoacyl-tRNA hydrolase [Actinomycetota bacterium]
MSPLWRVRPDGDRLVIAGLGNPGERYASTRHNAGAQVLDELAARSGAQLKRHRSGCLAAEVRVGSVPVVLARPTSFMNESGRQVSGLARFYSVSAEQIVVVHDELDIPFGIVRVKSGGGTAGHNGLRSVASHLSSKDFVRVRVGIGRPPGRQDPVDFVLARFSAVERQDLPQLISAAADAVERVVEVGAERAMNEVNERR